MLVASDGGVFTFGGDEAHMFHQSMGGKPLNSPIVGIASTPTGDGYWLVAADGGVFNFGDAVFAGARGGSPAVDLAASPTGGGYWLATVAGGVIAYGDAQSLGSAAATNDQIGITGTGEPVLGPIGGFYQSVFDSGSSASASSASVQSASLQSATVKSATVDSKTVASKRKATGRAVTLKR